MTERRCDVVITGGGPAGSALAKDCQARGLDALIVDPRGSWSSTYGTWVDDLDERDDAARLKEALRVAWPQVRVVGAREHRLARAYGFFDNEKLRAHLQVAPLLDERDSTAIIVGPDALRWRDLALSTRELAAFRRTCGASFGSCSFDEPVHDLAALHLT